MLDFLKPDLYVPSVLKIPLAELKRRGLRGLILDLDNTIAEWNRPVVDPEMVAWLNGLSGQGLKACLVSNSLHRRVGPVAKTFGLPAVPRAGKPRRRAFRQAMSLLGLGPQETAMVGDQLFTDILGGKRLGLYTVLVVPISQREFIGTKVIRRLERMAIRAMGVREGEGLV